MSYSMWWFPARALFMVASANNIEKDAFHRLKLFTRTSIGKYKYSMGTSILGRKLSVCMILNQLRYAMPGSRSSKLRVAPLESVLPVLSHRPSAFVNENWSHVDVLLCYIWSIVFNYNLNIIKSASNKANAELWLKLIKSSKCKIHFMSFG